MKSNLITKLTTIELTYNPTLDNLTIVKDEDLQHELVLGQGHPNFLIPDFSHEVGDIWLTYMDYLENKFGPIYDQEGGELEVIEQLEDGLVSVEYTAYDIAFESDEDESKDYTIQIQGYIIQDGENSYFLATKVSGDI